MVRHEAAEALGALGDKESLPLLEKYFKEDPYWKSDKLVSWLLKEYTGKTQKS